MAAVRCGAGKSSRADQEFALLKCDGNSDDLRPIRVIRQHRGQKLKPIRMMVASALAVAVIAGISNAAAAEAPPFPELDTLLSCRNLTSKMLVKSEQARETAKCVYSEGIARGQLQNHWDLVTPDAVKNCMKYQEPGRQSYFIFRGCVSYAIGFECIKGAYRCTTK